MFIYVEEIVICVQYVESRPGNFVDLETGKVVGHHKGGYCFDDIISIVILTTVHAGKQIRH